MLHTNIATCIYIYVNAHYVTMDKTNVCIVPLNLYVLLYITSVKRMVSYCQLPNKYCHCHLNKFFFCRNG